MRDFGNCLKILNRTDFVVRRHDGDERGIVGDGVFELLQINMTLLVHIEIGDSEAFVFKRLAGVEHCVMLNARSDDVPAAARRSTLYKTGDGKVVRLGTAAGKNDFGRVSRIQCLCNLGTCVLHGVARLVADAVQGRGVAVKFGQPRFHCVIYGFGHRRGCRIVRINKSAHYQMFASLWRFFTYNIHRNSMKYQAE